VSDGSVASILASNSGTVPPIRASRAISTADPGLSRDLDDLAGQPREELW
jgi:hypothetical protein